MAQSPVPPPPIADKPLTAGPPAAKVSPKPSAVPALCADRMEGLLEISNIVGSVMELEDILQEIARIAARICRTSVCSLYLMGPERQNLVLRANWGLGPETKEYLGQAKLPVGRGLPGIAAQTNLLIAVPDAALDPRHETVHGGPRGLHHAYICAPLRIQEEVIGVLTGRRDVAEVFTEEDCTLFETICKQVAIVIEKSRMHFAKIEADRLAAVSISLSEVAHYIKNLLQGMKGGIYFVDMGLKRGDLETARRGWGPLQRGNSKIASLVENMLNYSREIEMNIQPRNVNSLVYDILQQIDDTAVERGVALLPETQRELPSLPFDYDKIYDALLNLIANAIDAIPADKTDGLVMVRTCLSQDQHYVEVSVEDNGAGMTDDVQKRIFNLFFSTKGERGSGIGLAVRRKIVERHRGQIVVKSEPGRGTTFTMRLPVDAETGMPLA